ncbi:hypothetical protein PUR49_32655 [Streptomyces sp. BE147]|uniref:hypothetical protein n=1 Tax=Streptomyces sp. BE147 TaxID=3002524 RepID=UPI002E766502|nr:hypothetical protein [Streptomyces sp. BE147]MEE1741223.1 hypothetical protein [Streptomyces sp. BE147]
MAINSTPAPASFVLVADPDGRGAVLHVTYSHHLDGETLALRLYEEFAHQAESGIPLPKEIETDVLTSLLGKQGAYCAEGWHVSANEPTQQSWETVWPWAQAQVRRLMPNLTWSVESGRRIVMPWQSESGSQGASPVTGVRALAASAVAMPSRLHTHLVDMYAMDSADPRDRAARAALEDAVPDSLCSGKCTVIRAEPAVLRHIAEYLEGLAAAMGGGLGASAEVGLSSIEVAVVADRLMRAAA